MNEQRFTWVPFYRELAECFLRYSTRRIELIEIIRAVYQDAGEKLENVFRNVDTQSDIDPFTLFAGFNFGNQGEECRKRICSAYHTAFRMTAPLPENFDGVPMQFRDQKIFYSKSQEPSEFDILWEMFVSAYSYHEESGDGSFIQTYGLALNTHLKKDGTINGHSQNKLTKGLFYIRPDMFISLDKNNRSLLISLKQEALLPDRLQRLIGRVEKGDVLEPEAYLNLCKEVVAYLLAEKHETLLDFTYRAYKEAGEKTGSVSGDDTWFPALTEYNPGLTVDDWLDYMQHSGKFSRTQKEYLPMMYDYGGAASCTQLAIKFHRDAPALAGIATNFAKQAQQYLNCPTRTDEEGHIRYWSIPFLGRNASSKEDGAYIYKLRPELKEALERINIMQFLPLTTEVQKPVYPLNTILYGPPGTGKTYHTAIYAVAIIDNKTLDEVKQMPYDKVMQRYHELREKGQIAFTTFHQSYGYEDFIEGIRPMVTDGVEQDETNIIYKIESGVFKAFCDSVHEAKDAKTQFSDAWEAMVESIQNNADKPYIFTRKTGNTFNATLVAPDRLRVVWNGGTYNDLTEGRAYEQWLGKYDRSQLTGGNKWVYDAIQAVIDELITKFNLPIKPTEPGSQNRVFIIDEINRGNISKIFGELITLIEPSKRSGEKESISVRLPYSHTDFSVPNNVYLLGTMNTADRSIALLDTALRRRFVFKEMMPKPELLDGLIIKGIEVSKMLERMNQRIEVLYDREHTIGHAYFMPLREKDDEEERFKMLAEIFRDRIFPLLQEYFYDDYEKIRLVLGDNKTNDDAEMFIVCNQQTADIANLFGNTDMDFSDCRTYKLNPDAFTNIAAYKKI